MTYSKKIGVVFGCLLSRKEKILPYWPQKISVGPSKNQKSEPLTNEKVNNKHDMPHDVAS